MSGEQSELQRLRQVVREMLVLAFLCAKNREKLAKWL